MTFLKTHQIFLQKHHSKRMGRKNFLVHKNIYKKLLGWGQKNNSSSTSIPCKLNVYSRRNVFFIEKVQLSSCNTNHKIPIFLPYQLYKITFPKDTID